METRARRILDAYVRSEHFATFSAERVDAGAYSRNPDDRDRFARCHDAAENGEDGSTHAERLQDMRDGFTSMLRDRRSGFKEYPYRLEAAVHAEIDAIEAWHDKNGSLHN